MITYAALDVSQEATAICVVDETGRVVAEKKLTTCPEAISTWLAKHASGLVRVGMETGPLAIWLWNELRLRGVPIVCLDARHAHAALKMRPNKTDRNDAAGLAQIVRTGWFKQVRIKRRGSYEIRALLTSREVLVRIRVKIENEIRGLLRTFGVVFGRRAGGFARPADIPSTPRQVYRDEWLGFGDWLGTGTIAPQNRRYRSFADARAFVRSLGLTGQRNWKRYSKSGKLPSDIPTHPHVIYATEGWQGLGDWLGTGNVSNRFLKFRRFDAAREFARSLGLKSAAEWRAISKAGDLPADIPAAPNQVYARKGWESWGDWLGNQRRPRARRKGSQ